MGTRFAPSSIRLRTGPNKTFECSLQLGLMMNKDTLHVELQGLFTIKRSVANCAQKKRELNSHAFIESN